LTAHRRRKNLGFFPLIVVFLLACTVATVVILISIPVVAEAKFGSPDPSLGYLQRVNYGFQLLTHEKDLSQPINHNGSEILFEVKQGDNVNNIAIKLSEQIVIRSSEVFTDYLIYKGYDRLLQSGEFYLSDKLSIIEVAERLTSSTGDRTRFATLAGWRSEEIAESLLSYGFSFSKVEFLKYIHNPELIAGLQTPYKKYPKLEGFLFPAEYPIDREISASKLILSMVTQFDQKITPKMKKSFQKHGLDLYQAVILASIIEKEAVVDKEKPLIASVFYNRLATGMNLETDPTVQYAIGYDSSSRSWWKNPLSVEDLHTISPYNTYLNAGLPPSPISNPGIESLVAVAQPAITEYYYFRSACSADGTHVFSKTYDEHLDNACP